MHFTALATSHGVTDRTIKLADVTGVLWSPSSGPPERQASAEPLSFPLAAFPRPIRSSPQHGSPIPIQVLLPWDDAEIGRKSGLDLFDAFGLKEKTLHANLGGHHQVTVSSYKP